MLRGTQDNSIVQQSTKTSANAGRVSRAEARAARSAERSRCTPGSRADQLFARSEMSNKSTPGGRADRLFQRQNGGAASTPRSQVESLIAREGVNPVEPQRQWTGGQSQRDGAAPQTEPASDVGLRDAATVALAGTTRGAATRTLLRIANTDLAMRAALLASDATGTNISLPALAAAVVDRIWREQQKMKPGRSNG